MSTIGRSLKGSCWLASLLPSFRGGCPSLRCLDFAGLVFFGLEKPFLPPGLT